MKKSLFPRLALMAVVVALVSACSEKKFEYKEETKKLRDKKMTLGGVKYVN